MTEQFQVVIPGAQQALACHATGVFFWPSPPRVIETGATPQGVLCKCDLRNSTVPDPGRAKGGRSRPPPITPSGTAKPGIWP